MDTKTHRIRLGTSWKMFGEWGVDFVSWTNRILRLMSSINTPIAIPGVTPQTALWHAEVKNIPIHHPISSMDLARSGREKREGERGKRVRERGRESGKRGRCADVFVLYLFWGFHRWIWDVFFTSDDMMQRVTHRCWLPYERSTGTVSVFY